MANILLMEDETPLGLELLKRLKNAGHEATLVGTASQARDALWHWDYDLLITDMVIRRDGRAVSDGGLRLISWVRQTAMETSGLKYLPIIAITGAASSRGMDFLLPTADRIGADMVMEKPVDFDELLVQIEKLIALNESGSTSKEA